MALGSSPLIADALQAALPSSKTSQHSPLQRTTSALTPQLVTVEIVDEMLTSFIRTTLQYAPLIPLAEVPFYY